jgi:hypothetical protein
MRQFRSRLVSFLHTSNRLSSKKAYIALRFIGVACLAALGLVLQSGFEVAAQGPQLLQNAGFETGNSSPPSLLPSPWRPSPSTAPATEIGTEQTGVHSGSWNAHITPNNRIATIMYPIPVAARSSPNTITPGQRYTLSAWASVYGMEAALGWWNNTMSGGAQTCRRTDNPDINGTYPDYAFMSCMITTPLNIYDTAYPMLWGNGTGGAFTITDDWSLNRIVPAEGNWPNAIGVEYVGAYGSRATISSSDPSLNCEGQWVYHRAGVINDSGGHKFGEIGWIKEASGRSGFISFGNRSGIGMPERFNYVPGADRWFSVEWQPGTESYYFFYENTYLMTWDLGFSRAQNTFSGGEVAKGVESMGNVLYTNNFYVDSDGTNRWLVPYDYDAAQETPDFPAYKVTYTGSQQWRITGYD